MTQSNIKNIVIKQYINLNTGKNIKAQRLCYFFICFILHNYQLYNKRLMTIQDHLLRQYSHLDDSGDHAELAIGLLCFITLLLVIFITYSFGRDLRSVATTKYLYATPPHHFFHIWTVIFILLAIEALYSLIKNTWSTNQWILFACINVLAALWVFLFNNGERWAVNLAAIVLIVKCYIIHLMFTDLYDSTSFMPLLIKNTFSFFLGWTIFAAILGVGVIFVYTFEMSLKTHLVLFWVTAPIIFGLIIFYEVQHTSLMDNIGLIMATAYSLVGAIISSSRSW